MRVADSVRRAIDEWEAHEPESAMLHACNAIDGTAKKLLPKSGNKARFTQLLRENYRILGPMGMPGIDLVETRFPVRIKAATAPGGKPDLADVIYGVHRCCHAHGDELPEGFSLIEDAARGPGLTQALVQKGKVQLSDRIIFGLVAVAVFSPANTGEAAIRLDGYFLTFGRSAKLVINDWWGRANDFEPIAALEPVPSVKLDFGDWMDL